MTNCSLADLQKTLTPHVRLGKSRLETLCLLVLGMISARTVNLTHIAAAPTVKQHLAAIRMLFDWLVLNQVIPGKAAPRR